MSAPGGSTPSGRSRRPGFAVALAVAAGPAGLVGCDQFSAETRAAGATVVCSQIRIEPGEIEQNPDAARLAALVIRDLAPEENIRALADQVADNPTLLSPRAQLADWVADRCGGAIAGTGTGGGAGSGADDDAAGGGDDDSGAGDDD
ncbi:hypothetical protein UG55_1005351 [Frankia sp. EI5c]|nr:hypothetical protein UG55_1005351 [Frankia sp. EI5c]